MALVDVGDVLPSFGFTVTSNSTGALAAPSTFTVALTAPDSTTPTVTVTNPSTGIYAVTYVATQAGRYTAVGTAAGNGCDGVSTLVWDVAPASASEQPVVSAEILREHLGKSITASDESLRTLALVVTKAIGRRTGRTFLRRTVTEKHDGGKTCIALRKTPVASVTTVVLNGATLSASDWTLDEDAGVLFRGGTTSGPIPWTIGRRNITVTYTAGPTSVDEDVVHAHAELARHLWDVRRGGSNLPRQQGADDTWDPRMGFSVPRRVSELIELLVAPGF